MDRLVSVNVQIEEITSFQIILPNPILNTGTQQLTISLYPPTFTLEDRLISGVNNYSTKSKTNIYSPESRKQTTNPTVSMLTSTYKARYKTRRQLLQWIMFQKIYFQCGDSSTVNRKVIPSLWILDKAANLALNVS